MNGDGRDGTARKLDNRKMIKTNTLLDYLIWDDDGGLSGFLNQHTNSEGVPLYSNQGGAKSICDGFGHAPNTTRLADMDGYVLKFPFALLRFDSLSFLQRWHG